MCNWSDATSARKLGYLGVRGGKLSDELAFIVTFGILIHPRRDGYFHLTDEDTAARGGRLPGTMLVDSREPLQVRWPLHDARTTPTPAFWEPVWCVGDYSVLPLYSPPTPCQLHIVSLFFFKKTFY